MLSRVLISAGLIIVASSSVYAAKRLECETELTCAPSFGCSERVKQFQLFEIDEGKRYFFGIDGEFLEVSEDADTGFLSWGEDWKRDALRLYSLETEFQWLWFTYDHAEDLLSPFMSTGFCEEAN